MILASVLWALPIVFAVGGLVLRSPLGQAGFTLGWIAVGPVTLATWTIGMHIVYGWRSPPGIREFLSSIRYRTVTGLVFFLLEVLITALLVANVRFYFASTVGVLGIPIPWLGAGVRLGHLIGVLWLSPLVLWALMQLYFVAILAHYRTGGIGRVLRRSALLVLDNLPFTLAFAVVVVLLTGLLILSGVGMFVLFGGVMAVLTGNATVTLLSRYIHDELPGGIRID